MTPSLPIIPLSFDEYPEIILLWNEAGLPIKPTGRDHPDDIKKQLDSGLVKFFGVRSAEAKLIAVVLLTDDTRKGWINRLAVHPAYQRGGLAHQLIEFAQSYFLEKNIEVWCALIEDENEPSLNLFQQVGYIKHSTHYLTKRTRCDV